MLRRLLLVPLVGLALVGCGSGDGDDPFALVTTAGASTLEAGTARMAISSRVDVQGRKIDVSGEGVVQFDPSRISLTMQVPGAGEVELASEGTTVFLRVPPEAASAFGASTPWISYDLAAVGEAVSGTDFGNLASGSTDPAQGLALLRGASDDVEELGTEAVRGTTTTRYRATIDIEKALAQQGAVVDKEQFEQFLGTLGATTLPVDVWIDDEGRVRRQSFEQKIPGGSSTVTIELYDFGTDEPIELPPPDEVTDATDELTKLASG